jgi:DNA-binding NarL/FixJ family response regulator
MIAGRENPNYRIEPPRIVDGLLDVLPQDLVANFGFFQNLDDRSFVACRPPEHPNPINTLTAREYEATIMVAHGFKYSSIASDINSGVSTVRTHLHNAYDKLGINDKFEASSFFPIDYTELRSLKLYKLTDRELDIFEAIGRGISVKQTAYEHTISASTVRTHRHKIVNALGLRGDNDSCGIKLRRISGAVSTLEQHQSLLDEINNSGIQSWVGAIITKSAFAAIAGEIGALESATVHTIRNEQLVADLEKHGFVPADTKQHGRLNLNGLIAAILMKDQAVSSLMTTTITAPIVKAIIDQEVSFFFSRDRVQDRTQQQAA